MPANEWNENDGKLSSVYGFLLSAYWRLVQFGFHLLYNELAWTYDAVAWLVSLGEWAKWRRAAIPFVRGERVLELAHGTGHLLNSLRDAGFDVVGMDASTAMGRIARRRTGARVPLVQGVGQQLPFQDGIFDSVVVTFPTPFIIEQATLVSLRRILGAQGRIVIVPSGTLKGKGVIKQIIDWAFAATGQREGSDVFADWRAHFDHAGLTLRISQVDLGRSWVVILVVDRAENVSV